MSKEIINMDKTAVEKLQEFLEKERINIQISPEWIKRDDGTFSMVVKLTVDYKND